MPKDKNLRTRLAEACGTDAEHGGSELGWGMHGDGTGAGVLDPEASGSGCKKR